MRSWSCDWGTGWSFRWRLILPVGRWKPLPWSQTTGSARAGGSAPSEQWQWQPVKLSLAHDFLTRELAGTEHTFELFFSCSLHCCCNDCDLHAQLQLSPTLGFGAQENTYFIVVLRDPNRRAVDMQPHIDKVVLYHWLSSLSPVKNFQWSVWNSRRVKQIDAFWRKKGTYQWSPSMTTINKNPGDVIKRLNKNGIKLIESESRGIYPWETIKAPWRAIAIVKQYGICLAQG